MSDIGNIYHNHLEPVYEHPYLEGIDGQDNMADLVRKLNHNFSVILGTGIFDVEEPIPEEHDKLCDTLLIKPHQPIHRRKKIISPFEQRTDISWLKNVDYYYGDIAIVEQKRNDDDTRSRVYMYTIAKSKKNDDSIELINETEITGPTGKDGEMIVNLNSDQIEDFEAHTFSEMKIENLTVNTILFPDNGSLSVPKIQTGELQIGDNLSFMSSSQQSELKTNVLRVDEIYGYDEGTTNIIFGTPVKLNMISSNMDGDDKSIRIEDTIKVTKICGNPLEDRENVILFGSPLKSDGVGIEIMSPVHVNTIRSVNGGTPIEITSPIGVGEIYNNNNVKTAIKFGSAIAVDSISSNRNQYINIESKLNSTKEIEFIGQVNMSNDTTIDENKLHFKQFDYLDKHKDFGHVFLAFENMQSITIPQLELTSSSTLSKVGKPYSVIPTSGVYYLAEVEKGDSKWYMLITKSTKNNMDGLMRVVSTQETIANNDITFEDVYEIIASNDIYEDIYKSLDVDMEQSTGKTVRTVGFTKMGTFSTITGCTINIKKIPTLTSDQKFGKNNLTYYLTLY